MTLASAIPAPITINVATLENLAKKYEDAATTFDIQINTLNKVFLTDLKGSFQGSTAKAFTDSYEAYRKDLRDTADYYRSAAKVIHGYLKSVAQTEDGFLHMLKMWLVNLLGLGDQVE